MRILIGYDGSEHSEAALNDLRLAGLPRDAKSLVVSAACLLATSLPMKEVLAMAMPSSWGAPAASTTQSHGDRVFEAAEGLALNGADRLRSQFSEWEIGTRVVKGPAAWGLIEAADDWNASLVVVGAEGRSSAGRILLGSVSKRVVTDSRHSVRVARFVERKKKDAPPKIIIGVDGSAASQEAVFEVGRRVWQDGTQVRLIVAQDEALPIPDYDQSASVRAESMLEWARYHLKPIGLNVSMSIQRGDPKRILLSEARKWRADCIFVGSREFKSGFERYQLGSVSTAMVTNAPCSVEVVRP